MLYIHRRIRGGPFDILVVGAILLKEKILALKINSRTRKVRKNIFALSVENENSDQVKKGSPPPYNIKWSFFFLFGSLSLIHSNVPLFNYHFVISFHLFCYIFAATLLMICYLIAFNLSLCNTLSCHNCFDTFFQHYLGLKKVVCFL